MQAGRGGKGNSLHTMGDINHAINGRESETVFRTLAETTSAAIFIVQDQKIRYANPAARVITGYEPDELIGINFYSLADPLYQEVIKQRGVGNHWDSQIPTRYELKLQTKNYQERWVDITAGAMLFEGAPAYVITAFDITVRDLAEQALRKAKDDLEARVAERTAELQQANQRLQVELVERERAAEEREQLLTEVE